MAPPKERRDVNRGIIVRIKKRSMSATASGLFAIATIPLLGTDAVASTTTDPSAQADCFVSNPDTYNRYTWEADTRSGFGDPDGNIWIPHGTAEFTEYGEVLHVWDLYSEGHRTVVDFDICYGGKWIEYENYDSGPNEGDVDYEKYNLAFKDGRRLKMRVCLTDGNGGLKNCGGTTHMVA